MPFYLSSYVGSGDVDDPYRPAGVEGGPWSGVAFRSAPGQGFILVHADAINSDARIFKVAENSDERLSAAGRNAITNRLGIPETERGFKQLLFNALHNHGDFNDAGRWNPLKRSWRPGRTEQSFQLYLGPLFIEAGIIPATHNTIIVEDNFTGMSSGDPVAARTPSPTNTPGNNWTADGNIKSDGSGSITATANGQSALVDINTSDARVLVDFDHRSGDNRAMAAVRMPTEASSFDGYGVNIRDADNLLRILEWTTGTSTTVADRTFTINNTLEYTFGIEADGSTFKAFGETPVTGNPSQVGADATDTTSHTGLFAGFTHFKFVSSGGLFDNAIVDDLAAAGAILPQRSYPRGINQGIMRGVA